MRQGRAVAVVAALLVLLAPVVLAAPAGRSAAADPAAGRPVGEIVKDADAAFAGEDFRKAKALYAEATRLDAGQVHALHRLALIQSWEGELQSSIGNYRRALALAPNDFEIRLGLALVLWRSRDFAESIDLYNALRADRPDDGRVLLGLGNALAWAGRYEEAEEIYKQMEERKIEMIQAHAGRARLRGWQGQLDEAEHFWRDVLRADPGNLDARIGMAYVHHWQGKDRVAREQAENIVVDHPKSKEAQELKETIRTSLRPRAEVDAFRNSDTGSNREDVATFSSTFMTEPQTSIRIAYTTYDASFRCEDPQFCDEPDLVVGDEVKTRADTLTGALTAKVVSPLIFNARLGVVREESFDGDSRLVGILGGYLRWQVGPRFAVGTNGGRDVWLDTAPLIDRGILSTDANASVEFRFKPKWVLTGSAGAMALSDGNARRTAGAAIEWRLPVSHPKITGAFDTRYRAFNEDLDNGYFDPQRFDSELLTVAVWDEDRHGRFYWRLEGTYGRQAYTVGVSEQDDTVRGTTALAGVNFSHGKAALEATYTQSNYALNLAQGLEYSRTGFFSRFRF